MKNFKFFSKRYYTFRDLNFNVDSYDPNMIRTRIIFDNGYGASVVRGPYTYGGSEGLFELVVLDSNGDLCYDTPISNDVMGWLNPNDITRKFKEIQDL
jgi:hypothetical protein